MPERKRKWAEGLRKTSSDSFGGLAVGACGGGVVDDGGGNDL